jgi:23S rRNA (uracil1939-C5)-methyltransferase
MRVTALMTEGGADVAIERAAPAIAERLAKLAANAAAAGIARLSVGGEPLLTLAEPVVRIAGVALVPPPGAFLQASAEAEAAMISLVTAHLAGAKHVADLFCGVGTFALALARGAPVLAVETSRRALKALETTARRQQGLKPVTTVRRDLFANPLSAGDLAEIDGVVFDPPRAGAKAQAAALAASGVARVAAVSCEPATFARDARILMGGGYRLDRVVPIDQFVYSAATEIVGLFSRVRR